MQCVCLALNMDIGCVRSMAGFCQEDIGDSGRKESKGARKEKRKGQGKIWKVESK